MMLVLTVSNVAARTISVRSIRTTVPHNLREKIAVAVPAVPHGLVQSSIENHNRHKREEYDPYAAYFYYPSTLNNVKSSKRSTIYRRQIEDSSKSTQTRRRKLFVPNLFG